LAAPAGAQDADADLRARQEALFDRLLSEPDNLDLMFQHALVSIDLGDLEAAISTLERMLIYNPALGRAKVELGAAYFRLGAYENARYYFEDTLANDDPPPEVAIRVNAFLSEIGRRTQKTGFTGVALVGVTYSTNANLGPPGADVLLFGAPSTLQDEFVESSDFGVRAALFGSHYYDMGQPDGDLWRTDGSIFTLHFFDETRGDIDSFALRTGPRLSLTEQSFGPKIRPFVEVDALRADNDALYATFGGGVEYSDTLNDRMNLIAGVKAGYRDYFNGRDGFDGATGRAHVGLIFAVEEETSLRVSAFAEGDMARDDFNQNVEVGARLGLTHNYDSGFDFTDRLWTLSGYVQGAYREYDAPNPSVDPNRTRNDFDFRAGMAHVFHFTGGWFAQAEADLLLRDSNLRNFDLDNVGLTLSVGRSF
jgi:hypothetical protein